MSKRPTIHDLAKAAGVSAATVDRVLNSRSRVREATAQRVLMAAEDIGYHAAGLLKQRYQATRPHKRLAILLQRSNDFFYQAFGEAFEQAISEERLFHWAADIIFMDEVSPSFINEQLSLANQTADAIAIVTIDHSIINQKIDEIRASGKPVITLLSELSNHNCTSHIGLDNRKAGRSAAWALSRLTKQPGEIGILLGTHRYHNQEIAEISFISYFREINQGFTLLPSIINLDDERLAAEATAQLLADHPNLVGIYSAGGGVKGMLRSLRAEPRGKDLVVVCNELMPETRQALTDGYVDLVLSTPIDKLAHQTIQMFSKALSNRSEPRFAPVLVPAEIYMQENI